MKQLNEWNAMASVGVSTRQLQKAMYDFAIFILIASAPGLNPRWKHLWRNSKSYKTRNKYKNLLYKEALKVRR